MIKYSKVIASNTDLETSQAFVYRRDKTYLVLLFSISGEDVFSRVRQLASDLEEKFFDLESSLGQRVERSLSWLDQNLKEVERKDILVASWEDSPQIILFLKSLGSQRAFLYREKITPLLSSNKLISGFLHSGDKLLFLNETLTKYLQVGEGEKTPLEELMKMSVDDLEEEVNSLVIEHQRGEPVAAVMVDIQGEGESAVLDEPVAPDQPKEESSLEESIHHIEDSVLSQKRLISKLPNLASLRAGLQMSIPKTKKGQLYFGLALILILFIGIGLTIRSKGEREKDAIFQNLLSQAKSEYQSAQSLKDLDASGAQQSLTQAQNDLTSALKIEPGNKDALALKGEIQSHGNDILKVYPVESWPLFLDLGLIKSGFSTDRLSFSLGKILLLDKSQRSLVMIDLGSKNNQILSGGDQIGSPQEASLNGSNAFVFSKDKGVVRVDIQTTKPSLAIKSDSDWGEITDIEGFGGNIYLLDNIKNQIWKYIGTNSGYSDKNNYLRAGVKADFSGAKKILIDSSVWVLGQNSQLDRFTAGSPDSYSVGGLDKPITNLTDFFISDKTTNMYLLDSGNSRLVVTDKSGKYLSQYTGDKFKSASDFVVDESGKKIYLLVSNKIYSIDLH